MPLQHRIAESFRNQIAAGQLAPGDLLPKIADVAAEWSCTLATAQKALSLLKDEGLVTGGRGKQGTVRMPPHRVRLASEYGQLQKDSVKQPAEERDIAGAVELTTGIDLAATKFVAKYETIAASDDLAAELGVSPGADLLKRTYETSDPATGYLILWSVSYIPRALIEGDPRLLDEEEEPWAGGHLHQLYTVGIEVDHFVNTVIATAATAQDRDRWGMDTGVPLLRTRRRSIDTTGRVVEVSDAAYPADRTEICWTEQLQRWS
jgi:GntR family transcriptional regulator